jgi:hypothetical protein
MPVYLQSTSTKIPELKRVIVALGNKVAMAQTLGEALSVVIGLPTSSVGIQPQASAKPKQPTVPGLPTTRISEDVTRMINQAVAQYNKALNAQKKGDWTAYGENMNALEQTLKELQSRAK